MQLIRKVILYTLMSFFFLVSCTKDFEEINTNPYGFTTAGDGPLFNGIMEQFTKIGNEELFINIGIFYKQTQQMASAGQGFDVPQIGISGLWRNYYLTLPNFRELEKRFDKLSQSSEIESEVNNMKAMLKILLAYKTFKLTDIFGDIPFFQAGYGFHELEYLYPKYDKQENIYKFLLDELKWCDENIDVSATGDPHLTFAEFDMLFKGDMLMWHKLANSLRLRHAIRMYEKEPELAGQIVLDVVENDRPVIMGIDFIAYAGESAHLLPITCGFKNTWPQWAFNQSHMRMGSTIWKCLSDHDSTDGSGIFDPRTYIFFETNYENSWKPYPQISGSGTNPSGGTPYSLARGESQSASTFNKYKGEGNIYSPANYFIIGDESYMPLLFFTGAEVHFLKAEAYLRGIGVAANPEEADIEYSNGVLSSVDWWKNLSDNLKLPSGATFKSLIPDHGDLGAFEVLKRFDFNLAESEEEKLSYIYTQRWLDAFRQPWEAYALARRTGKTPREGENINHFRLPYPTSEMEYNTENCLEAISRQGGDDPGNKIWWMPEF